MCAVSFLRNRDCGILAEYAALLGAVLRLSAKQPPMGNEGSELIDTRITND